ncbi:hypothetical protein BaOVIS_021780 [Babesia ovis]|uniref:Eukaryotic membrane protein n=1 Tax=Babesia ovis TaxID=5869 RepID=A0A9W5TEK2_BABOV|nr:hypothetical protein BaOVIS_021780 [Babesia ovis]
MKAFYTNLADFICLEMQGFPFIIREHPREPVYVRQRESAFSDSSVKRTPSTDDSTCDDEILDPVDSIPENSLKHMLRLPKRFERIMIYSLCICFDALLFELTLMPIQAVSTFLYILQKCQGQLVELWRYCVAIVHGLFKPTKDIIWLDKQGAIIKASSGGGSAENRSQGANTDAMTCEYRHMHSHHVGTSETQSNTDEYVITPVEACGFARFVALIMAVLILSRIDTSRVYHNIRGQPFFKLYVIFNMLEVCERLCRSLGRDCIDTLMRATIKMYKLCSNFNLRRSIALSAMNPKERTNDSGYWLKHAGGTIGSPKLTVQGYLHIAEMSTLGHGNTLGQTDTPGGIQNKHAFSAETSEHCEVSQFVLPGADTNAVPSLSKADLGQEQSPRELTFADLGDEDLGNKSDGHNFLLKDLSSSLDTIADTVFPDSSRDPQEYENVYMELFLRYVLVLVYVTFHAFMHLIRVLILNIAINSSDSAMFLLMVTNNFAEIKSTVFKKYNDTSLFTIVATDAVERFHFYLDGIIVFFKMCTVQSPWNSYLKLSRWLTKTLVLEVLIDYFKHGFLLKFNKIGGEIFKRYTEVLMGDVLLSRCQRHLHGLVKFDFRVICKGAYSFPHIQSRRLGFMPSPILALIICNIPYIRNRMTLARFVTAVFIWLSLLFLKITLSILILAHGIKKRKNLLRLKSPMDGIGAL